MKDPQVQDAIDKLKELINQINELNLFFHDEQVVYDIAKKGGTATEPPKYEISYLTQMVKYE